MSVAREATVECPACKRSFQWQREFAGCTIECPCGQSVDFPFNRPGDEGDVYDLGGIPPPPPRTVQAVAPVEPPSRVLNYRVAPPKPQTKIVHEIIADKSLRALFAPMMLLLVGIVARVVVVFVAPPGHGLSPLTAILTVVMSTLTMLIGVGAVAKFMGSDLGELPVALAKLMAIAIIGNVAFAAVLIFFATQASWEGPTIAWHVVLLVHFVMISMLFDLDLQESLFAVAVVGALQAILMIAIIAR
jgi:hypothetical protein